MKRLIYVLALIKFVLPFVLQHSVYEPHRDEFLYLAEAHHPAWGYLELPPVLSVLAWVSNVLGGSLFWIRFWPSLGGALTYVLVGRMILLLGGGRFALVLGFLPFVFGYFLHVHFILQPNFLEMFFWTLLAYGLIRYTRTQDIRGLYIAGAAFGLGMMSKYSGIFFSGGLLAGLLCTPERRIFRNRHFYFSLLLGLLLFLPNIIWQGLHGWPVANHMLELQQQQLDQVNRLNFLLDQLSYNLPSLPVWMAGLYWLFAKGEGKAYRYIGIAVVLVLAFLFAARGKSYYAMGVYPVLFVFGAVCLEKSTRARPGWRYGLIGFAVVTGCYIDTIAIPLLPPQQLASYYQGQPLIRRLGFLRWEDQRDHPLPQDFADMLGWKEMADKAARVYAQNKDDDAIIMGGNYGQAGALDHYGEALGLPPAMGHAASYVLWTPANFYDHHSFVLVDDDRSWIHGEFWNGFAQAVVADSITTPYAREYGSYILLLKDPSPEVRRQWADSYEKRRRKF